jgi:hypothetical protein
MMAMVGWIVADRQCAQGCRVEDVTVTGVRREPNRVHRCNRVEDGSTRTRVVEQGHIDGGVEPGSCRNPCHQGGERIQHQRQRRVRNQILAGSESHAGQRRSQMGVRIVEPGDHGSPSELEAPRCGSFRAGDFRVRPYRNDPLALDRDRFRPGTQ